MNLKVNDVVRDEEWDAALRSLGGSIYHCAEWADYVLLGHPSAKPQYLSLLADDGKLLGMALAFRNKSLQKILAPFTGRMRLEAMPVVENGDEGLMLQFLRQLVEHSRRAGDVDLEVGSFASFSGGEQLESQGFSLSRRFEFELDLQACEECLWNGMEHKRRKNVHKAERSGVVLEDLNNEEGVASLRRLQGASSKRIVARGGPDIAYRNGRPKDPITALLDSGLGRIVGARVDGQIVSAGLFTQFNHLVYHTLSGHDEEALRTQAPTLLLWETIKRYKAEGAERFNFGGCPASAADEASPSHGIYVYKMGFGGRRLECLTGHRILRKVAYGTLRRLKRLLRRS
jgi:CelD/BcsL family acetyltransferase involved in cellulose biosynthesis